MMITEIDAFSEIVTFAAAQEPIDRHDWLALASLTCWNQLGIELRYMRNSFPIGYARQFPFMPLSRSYATLFYQSKSKDQIIPWYASASLLVTGMQNNFYGSSFTPGSQLWTSNVDPFFTINLDLRRSFKKFDLFGGVENILNFRQTELVQSAVLTGTDFLDAGAVWGPTLGRRIHAGIALNLSK